MIVLKILKRYSFLSFVLAFLIGVSLAATGSYIYAQVVPQVIHGCIKENGDLYVRQTSSCKKHEKELDWNQQGPQGLQGLQGLQGIQGSQGPAGSAPFGLPFICNSCVLYPYAANFVGKDLSNAQLMQANFSGGDFHGVILKNAVLDGAKFNNTTLTGADLSNLLTPTNGLFDGFTGGVTFDGANLTNANLSGDKFSNGSFMNTNLQNTNFTNTSFNGEDFTGALNFSTANLTGTTWSGTTCPDGTNSDDNGNTCVGH